MILQDDTIQVFYQIVSNRKIERQQNPPKTIFLIVKWSLSKNLTTVLPLLKAS